MPLVVRSIWFRRELGLPAMTWARARRAGPSGWLAGGTRQPTMIRVSPVVLTSILRPAGDSNAFMGSSSLKGEGAGAASPLPRAPKARSRAGRMASPRKSPTSTRVMRPGASSRRPRVLRSARVMDATSERWNSEAWA